MSAEDFARSLKLVLVDEGGLDDDPHDHGGRTAHGIIQREYDGFRTRKGLQRRDVWEITPAEYTEIYHDRYWEPWCDQLPPGVDYAFFDACVNAGPVQAARTLQKVLNARVDGHMGEATLSLARSVKAVKLVEMFCEERRRFYRALKQFPRYGRGWLARVAHVERAAKEMAVGGEPVRNGLDDELKAQATTRAAPEEAAVPPVSVETAAAVTTVTTVGSGASDQLSQVTAQLQPLQESVQFVKYILVAVALVSFVFTVYAIWHRSKVKEAIA